MPISTRTLTIKRGDGSTAGGGSATTVGTYLAENCTIGRPATVIDRIGVSGEDQGAPTVIRKKITFSCKVQIAIALTNSVRPGDYFEESIDVDSATASTSTVRFVIGSCTKDETAGNPHTYSLEASEDMPHSTQYGGS
jgi:NDP-sugar pyrophosphorylase family protein